MKKVVSQASVRPTPAAQSGRADEKPLTMPQFVLFSMESTPGSRLDAWLKVKLARIQLESGEREFQLHKEFKRLEADTAVKLVKTQTRMSVQFPLLPA